MILELFLEQPHPCPYLPEEECQNLLFETKPFPAYFTAKLLDLGFRHFGTRWFIPVCENCTKCLGVKIDTQNFTPTKSQRKLLKKNAHLTIKWSEVSLSPEKIDLINKYHADQEFQVGWFEQKYDEISYHNAFINGNRWAEEYTIYDDDRLIGVGIMDLTNERASSIYFYYDPKYRANSLGTWSILQEILLCKEQGREWLHLGLWNEECNSLSYKNRFSPHTFLPVRNQEGIVNELEKLFSEAQ